MILLSKVQLSVVKPLFVAHDLHHLCQTFTEVREIAFNRVQSIDIIFEPINCCLAYSRTLSHDLKDVYVLVNLLKISLCELIVEILHNYLRAASG